MGNKCHCGYEIKTPHEQNMFAKWECARAIELNRGFNVPATNNTFSASRVNLGMGSLTCSHDGTPPELDDVDEDEQSFASQFVQKYDKPQQEEKPKEDKPTDPGNRWNSIT